MKYIFLLMTVLAVNFQLFSQIELGDSKVKWTFSIEQKECEATLIATVKMVPNWHINAIVIPSGSFGYATAWSFQKSNSYKLLGNISEPKPSVHFDEASGENLATHSGTVRFKQKIKILDGKDFDIKGAYSFQTCNEEMCLPPFDGKFTLKVKACPDGKLAIDEDTSTVNGVAISAINNETKKTIKQTKYIKTQKKSSKSLWETFLTGLGYGFIAILTPCVFPMLPMTVSFFTKRSKTKKQGRKNALLYGFSIIAIYITLGVVITAIFGGTAVYKMSSSPIFNFIFFIILIIFAISFMGAFEIRMPSKWINGADKQADKGGYVGIFFMALVLALVSFSCTGVFVGNLLIQSVSGDILEPIIGMFAFSFALALPFVFFSYFPSYLNSLPTSGGWLNTVKVVLGLVELALAFKFLSNADLALQYHLLEREVFIAIWIAIFAVLALYLLGFILFPHDDKLEKIGVGRGVFGIFVLAFVIYMIPGLWGAPLKIINAFPPPLSYSESPLGVGSSKNASSDSNKEVANTHLGPQGIQVFDDYDLALEYAKKVNKPLFVDFTGHTCVNCRKMEESVWGEPGIIEHLRDDVIVVSLHVDDQKELPIKQQKTVIIEGREYDENTYGDKWLHKEMQDFKISAQPYYVLIGTDGKQIPVGSASFESHKDPVKFSQWIKKGLKK